MKGRLDCFPLFKLVLLIATRDYDHTLINSGTCTSLILYIRLFARQSYFQGSFLPPLNFLCGTKNVARQSFQHRLSLILYYPRDRPEHFPSYASRVEAFRLPDWDCTFILLPSAEIIIFLTLAI